MIDQCICSTHSGLLVHLIEHQMLAALGDAVEMLVNKKH